MGFDLALGISGNAMTQWQQRVAAQNNRMAHEQFMAMQNVQSGPPMFRVGPVAQAHHAYADLMRQYSRNCEYCGSTGSITDHGKGLMKCGNCGAS